MRKYNIWILLAVVCSTGFYAAHVASFRSHWSAAGSHAYPRAHFSALQPYSHLHLMSSANGFAFIDLDTTDHGWLPADSTARNGLRRYHLADLEYSFAPLDGVLPDPDLNLAQYDAWSAGLLQQPMPLNALFRETQFPKTPPIGGNTVAPFAPAWRVPDQPIPIASVTAPEPAALTALSGLLAIACAAIRIRPRRRQLKH